MPIDRNGNYTPYTAVTDPYLKTRTGGDTGFMNGGSNFSVGDIAKGVGSWIGKHPDVVTGVLGAGASIYGAKKQGDASEAELAQRAVESERQYGLNQRAQALDEQKYQSDQAQYAAEQARRRRALVQVLGMYAGRQKDKNAVQIES